jgi:beta-lactamase regulating signal transducer with metallopeptidase domain
MTPFFEIAGWTLIHFVWQGTAVGLATAAALRLAARRSPNVRYVVACAGLALMMAAPVATARLLSFDVPLGRNGENVQVRLKPDTTYDKNDKDRDVRSVRRQPGHATTGASALIALAPDVLERVPVDRVVRAVTMVWLLGVSLLLGRMAGGWWYVRRLHRAAMSTPASHWQAACRRIAYRLGLHASAHVVESPLVNVPTVIGWLRPAIILPVAAIAALSPAQVEAVLAHELAHIRRHDYAVNLLQTIAETVLFYHPAVWWVSSRIRAEREHCCDEVAVRISGNAVAYARALAELEAWRNTAPTLAVAATGGSLL